MTNPLPPQLIGLKETLTFHNSISVWSSYKQSRSLSIEGDAGFASWWVQDFVVGARSRPQSGLMTVNCRYGLRYLCRLCFCWASFLALLSSGCGVCCSFQVRLTVFTFTQQDMILGLVWVCQRCSGSDWGPKYVTGLSTGWIQTLSSLHRSWFIKDSTSFASWRICPLGYVFRFFGWSKNIRCHPMRLAWRNTFFWASKNIVRLSSRGFHGSYRFRQNQGAALEQSVWLGAVIVSQHG